MATSAQTTKKLGRPRIEDDLRPLVMKHHGDQTAIGAELGISRQAVADRLERRGLARLAAVQRAKHGVVGSHRYDPPGERERIIKALAKHDTHAAAAEDLGMHRNRLKRRIERYAITDQDIATAKEAQHAG